MNTNIFLHNYLKSRGTELVSEKSLRYILPLIYPTIIREISIDRLADYYDIKLSDENLKAKRFDYVSLDQKLVIEFDGGQHFKYVEHFGSYAKFLKLQQTDFLKHKFIKQYNFNLIRVTGKLTMQQLYDLLKNIDFNTKNPKVVFIENDQMNSIGLNQLSDLSEDIDLLQTKIMDLENQLKVKNDQLKSKDEKIEELENQIEPKNKNKSKVKINLDDVRQYNDWLIEQELDWCTFPSVYNYEIYVQWLKENSPRSIPLKRKTFSNKFFEICPEFGYEKSRNARSTATLSDLDFCLEYLNKYCLKYPIKITGPTKSIFIKMKNQITEDDLSNFYNTLLDGTILDKKHLSYKEYMMLKHYINKNDPLAESYFKLLKDNKVI